ncbi:MAG: hypothetical protein ACRD1V_19345 [Vicinamibacterales bacterium]
MDDLNPRLIRLLARRYGELQGLRTAADAGVPIILGVGWLCLYGDGDHSERYAVALGLVLVAYLVCYWTRIRRGLRTYYVTRFGRAHSTWFPDSSVAFAGILYPPILADFHAPLAARMSFLLLLLCARPAWVVVRDWPYRVHWLLPALVGAAAAAAYPSFPTVHHSFEWQATAFTAYGSALVAAGLLDHLLLLRTMKRPPEIDAVDAHD